MAGNTLLLKVDWAHQRVLGSSAELPQDRVNRFLNKITLKNCKECHKKETVGQEIWHLFLHSDEKQVF